MYTKMKKKVVSVSPHSKVVFNDISISLFFSSSSFCGSHFWCCCRCVWVLQSFRCVLWHSRACGLVGWLLVVGPWTHTHNTQICWFFSLYPMCICVVPCIYYFGICESRTQFTKFFFFFFYFFCILLLLPLLFCVLFSTLLRAI